MSFNYNDDKYYGYNEIHPQLSTEELELQNVPIRLKSNIVHRKSVADRFYTTPVTPSDVYKRPISALQGAGYNSADSRKSQISSNSSAGKLSSPDEKPNEIRVENKIKRIEAQIVQLINESVRCASKKDFQSALEKAKAASSKEKILINLEEHENLTDSHNLDLTFTVLLNLANQYELCQLYTEAIGIYKNLAERRVFQQGTGLHMNLGNIYFHLNQFDKAMKHYQKALDRIPSSMQMRKLCIMNNIGQIHMTQQNYKEACTCFQYIINKKPQHSAGLDLIICQYMLADIEGLKNTYTVLLNIPTEPNCEEKYGEFIDEKHIEYLLEAISNDALHTIKNTIQKDIKYCLLLIVNLLCSLSENSDSMYHWCIDKLQYSFYATLLDHLQVNQAVDFIEQGKYSDAMNILTLVVKRGTKLASPALQGEITQAEECAIAARDIDRYNHAAFINLGCCYWFQKQIEKAKQYFKCALECDSTCIEAIYNFGLANKSLGLLEEAKKIFLKLYAMSPTQNYVLFHLGNIAEQKSDIHEAINWYEQLIALEPFDSHLLCRIGKLYALLSNMDQAYQYYLQAYKLSPLNSEIIDWLGIFQMQHDLQEKAISYYQVAIGLEPKNSDWLYKLAKCYKNMANYKESLRVCENIIIINPHHKNCLKLLIEICSVMNMPEEVTKYTSLLNDAESFQKVTECQVEKKLNSDSKKASKNSYSDSGNSQTLFATSLNQNKLKINENSYQECNDQDFVDDLLPE